MERVRRTNFDAKTSFWMPRTTLRALKERAIAEDVSMCELVIRAIDAYLTKIRKTDEAR